MQAESSIQCFDYLDHDQGNVIPLQRPLKLAIITSIRDVGREDNNGRTIQHPDGPRYRMGVPEALTRMLTEGRHEIADLIRLVGVITDDTDRDRLGGYAQNPDRDGDWIHPRDLSLPNGELLTSNTTNIPSEFRGIPKNAVEEKQSAKKEFEQAIARQAEEMGADIILSDHLMLRIQNMLQGRYHLGKILNIHPAMTNPNSPYALPGKTPTADALKKAQETGGFLTGGTFHFIDEEIDHGQVIAEGALTSVLPTDSPSQLRSRNYPAKIAVFIEGMRHYCQNLYPHLDRINFTNFDPTNVLSTECPDFGHLDPSFVRAAAQRTASRL